MNYNDDFINRILILSCGTEFQIEPNYEIFLELIRKYFELERNKLNASRLLLIFEYFATLEPNPTIIVEILVQKMDFLTQSIHEMPQKLQRHYTIVYTRIVREIIADNCDSRSPEFCKILCDITMMLPVAH